MNNIMNKLESRTEEVIKIWIANPWPQMKNTLIHFFSDERDKSPLLKISEASHKIVITLNYMLILMKKRIAKKYLEIV